MAGSANSKGFYKNITQALRKAEEGDTILIDGGVYAESLVVKISVCLCAAPGQEVIIKGHECPAIVACSHIVRLQGLTMEHGGGNAECRGAAGPRCVEVAGGILSLTDCSMASEIGSGVMVLGPASVTLRKCKMNRSGRCGLLGFTGASVTCEDSELSCNGLNGLDVQSGCTASITRCKLIGNAQTGILLSDLETKATVGDSVISDNNRRGVTSQFGAHLVLRDSEIKGNTDEGVYVISRGLNITTPHVVQGCCIQDNGAAAVLVEGGGLSLEELTVNDIQGDVSIMGPDVTVVAPARERFASPIRKFEAASPATPNNTPMMKPAGSPERHAGVLELEQKVAHLWGRFDQLTTNLDDILMPTPSSEFA